MFIGLALTGCSKAVVIPREELSREEYRKTGSYRVKLHGWNEYDARRFSMTDSTVVIEELLMTDDHYKLKRHEMPFAVPLRDVEYVAVMETNKPVTYVAGGLFAALVIFSAWLVMSLSGVSGS